MAFITSGLSNVVATAQLFWSSLQAQFSLLSLIDIFLAFLILNWLFRRLRRTDLIKVLPRLLLLLILIFVSRILGLWAVFYLSGFLLLVSLLAIASLYAADIKNVLEMQKTKSPSQHHAHPVSTSDLNQMIRAVTEAVAVLVRSEKSALIVIKHKKPVTRLTEHGNAMNSVVKPELLIDLFASGSALSKGAVVIDGNRIVAAGSTLWRPNAKVLFNMTNPDIVRVAKDMGAVVIVFNKTLTDVSLLSGDDSYRHLAPPDLAKLLERIFIYNSRD